MINAGYLSDERDLVRLARIARRSYEIAEAMGAFSSGLVVPDDLVSKPKDDAFWREMVRRYATTLYHPCATCKMGRVVDSDLRVMGVSGLRVVDASVFPHNVRASSLSLSLSVVTAI